MAEKRNSSGKTSSRSSGSRGTSQKKRPSERAEKTREREWEQEREAGEGFGTEIALWVVIALALLLFISNFGVGGAVGNAVSSFFFGLFGLGAYVFPILLVLGSFFVVSNRGNGFAILKMIAVFVFAVALFLFIAMLFGGEAVGEPKAVFSFCSKKRIGGGMIGGALGNVLSRAFGAIGTYIIDIIVMIVALVVITERSALKGMKKGGEKVYRSARESSERHREERAKRRMDRKVSGVCADTKIEDPDRDSDELSELHEDDRLVTPDIREKKRTSLRSADSDEMTEFPPRPERAAGPVISGSYVRDRDRQETSGGGLGYGSAGSSGRESGYGSAGSSGRESGYGSAGSSGKESAFGVVGGSQEPQKKLQNPVTKDSVKRKTKTLGEEIDQAIAGIKDEVSEEKPIENYSFPPSVLLKLPEHKAKGNTESQLRETAQKLEETLKTFGVNVTVTNISCGPSVTRYEVQPELGVKVSKIVNLADDLKLNLAASDIRIEAPIPGKAAVGIEVPNAENVMVSFRELIESDEFRMAKSRLSFAVGKDISGKITVTDIYDMPHLLIAGATGSGKSVCINTIIMSILYKARPDEVKLIMVDPKRVELSIYNGIPHLLIPVVTDAKKAAGALNWAVAEMMDRYEKFEEVNVRKISSYNERIDSLSVPAGQEKPKKMPHIVIIVDELADLMLVASKEVEEAIQRITQLARAAGIHLVIATQRPSVNVITGTIKANMPSRIAFAVSSGIDSRTILDMTGAENLLGKGDMLFFPQGLPKPVRMQGAFISDQEVAAVVKFLTEKNGTAQYNQDVQDKMEKMEISAASASGSVAISDGMDEDGRDSYFIEAAQIITEKEKASIGMLQRYLKVGFNRAARIMDQLEEAGIVGPEEGTKPRRVLMTPEDFQRYIDENG